MRAKCLKRQTSLAANKNAGCLAVRTFRVQCLSKPFNGVPDFWGSKEAWHACWMAFISAWQHGSCLRKAKHNSPCVIFQSNVASCVSVPFKYHIVSAGYDYTIADDSCSEGSCDLQ